MIMASPSTSIRQHLIASLKRFKIKNNRNICRKTMVEIVVRRRSKIVSLEEIFLIRIYATVSLDQTIQTFRAKQYIFIKRKI